MIVTVLSWSNVSYVRSYTRLPWDCTGLYLSHEPQKEGERKVVEVIVFSTSRIWMWINTFVYCSNG